MTVKFSEICPPSWRSTPDGLNFCQWMDDFCQRNVVGSSVLLIGAGYDYVQYNEWPSTLQGCGALYIEYLEIDKAYKNKWDGGPYPITLGDARNIKNIFSANAYDVVMWIQGPEHIKQEEMTATFDGILEIARKAVLLTCPYGGYYDKQGPMHSNPNEDHVQKSMDIDSFKDVKEFNILLNGKKDASDGSIIIWREK